MKEGLPWLWAASSDSTPVLKIYVCQLIISTFLTWPYLLLLRFFHTADYNADFGNNFSKFLQWMMNQWLFRNLLGFQNLIETAESYSLVDWATTGCLTDPSEKCPLWNYSDCLSTYVYIHPVGSVFFFFLFSFKDLWLIHMHTNTWNLGSTYIKSHIHYDTFLMTVD